MHLSLRSTLAAALAAALLSGTALAQPVKVKLPKGAPQTQREPPAELKVEDKQGLDRKSLKSKGRFMLDFDKVDIDKLVQTISDMTGKLFILPDNIRGKITIIGPEHGKVGVTAEEAYAAFLSALDSNGLTLYPTGKYMKIVEKRAGKQSNIPTMLEEGEPYTLNEQMMTKLFRLNYVEAEPVRAVIQQLVSRDGDTIAFPPDAIIVNDIGLNMHRLERIIARLDQPASSNEIRVVQIQYAAATDVAEKIRSVFEEKQRQPGQRSGAAIAGRRPNPKAPAAAPSAGSANAKSSEDPASLSQLIADERTNKLIIVANDKAFERIEMLLTHLDTPVPGEGQVHVYYLENANAEELASTLASLTQGINRPSGPRPPTPPAGAAKGTPTVADLFSGEMKITADKGTNSLVIVANNTDYRNLVKVIEQLDIARRQVFVEAVIMEVNLKNTNDFGISLHGGAPASLDGEAGDESVAVLGSQIGNSRSLSGILSLAQLGGFLAGLQGPLLESFPIPAFSIVMQALQKSSDVNVLSTPHILTSDNEEAEITVGQNVPFQAGVTSSLLGSGLGSTAAGAAGLNSAALGGLLGGYGGLIAPIQRTNVELKLKIKPQINESDFIRLQIEEQTEEIAERDPQLGPTTAKRSAKTTIVARDQQTVVIGGLIQERTVKSVEKTPLLGDIPVVGRLFRSTSTEKMKTNLLLFLTPYIVRDQADFRRIFERKLKERQEFVEQFYGRQPGYNVPIDYARKAGPLATMFKAQEESKRKAENGGPGAPDEKLILPSARPSRGGTEGSEGGAESGEGPGHAAPATPVPGGGEGPSPAPFEPPAPPEVHEPPADAD